MSITLNQTLHGYSSGHHLLASSISLSETSKRKMDILSDLSGPDIAEGFEDYFSGYFLETEQLIVLAKTWYAGEMSRPGCVWTHSILFKLDDIDDLSQGLDDLLTFFVRPSSNINFDSYSLPLAMTSLSQLTNKKDKKRLQYLLWVMFGHQPPNMIISKNSNEYLNELLYLWLTCYRELPPSYSFITGSMSIRSDSENTICLQFVPQGLKNRVYHSGMNISVLKSIDEVQKFPPWVSFACNIIQNGKWSAFVSFRNLFGHEYSDFKYLTSFIKFYSVLCGKNGFLNLYESLELIEKLFSNQKISVGNKLLQLYFEGALTSWGEKISYTNTIIATLKFEWISVNENSLNSLVSNSFDLDKDGAKKVVQYLAKIENSQIQERYLSLYANLLSAKMLEEFTGMDYGMCSVLITLNPALAECDTIWTQALGYQKGILDSLKICKESATLSKKIAYKILDTSSYDFSCEIFTLWGESAIQIFLEYLLQFRTLLHRDTAQMVAFCKAHSKTAACMFEEKYSTLSIQQVVILLDIIDPYTEKVSEKILIKSFEEIALEDLSIQQKNCLADFYLPLILRSSTKFPNDLVAFAVTNVHDRLANLLYPEDRWRKLQTLLPDTTWLNQWDKCKRVRKAIKKKGYNIKKLDAYNDNEMDIHLL
ncbi:hypothetical protein [Clostridium sp. D33t1_170424_F3]|uniref:GAP1-N1 domain-containing protein n=1 Tax=Clostridium sp. D33t1_170424_F3 TaxID=2787099 RepID=UPI0018AA671A|nr:hypothetical protein [Clostridium sp. D33t1_170424_F3]